MLTVRRALRELGRRRIRTALTTGGIAIGVTTLILLGALSEKMSRLVAGGRDFAMGQITVSGAGTGALTGMSRGGLLSGEQLTELATVPGVSDVAPIVMFPLSDAPSSLPFTLAPLVFGVDVDTLVQNQARNHTPPPPVRAGRILPRAGKPEVVVGSQVARLHALSIGSALDVRGRTFTVVGILDTTFTGPDSFIFMSFPVAERLLIDTEPLLRRIVTAPGATLLPIATAAAVFWRDGADPEAVAAAIRQQIPNLSVVSPLDAGAQIDRALAVLTSVILASGLVALLVASLAVANTMFTAVVERRREIGLLRVAGATRRQVVRQLVVEACTLGLGGSLLGLALGGLGVTALNVVTERLGAPAFLLTPRLAAGALGLPSLLAAAAGLLPAWRAARLAPTQALRYG